jgi:NAD(P)H-dependent FMN reductase
MTHDSIISVFLGSIREGRNGIKVARWVVSQLEKKGCKVHLIDPAEHQELLTLRMRHRDNQKPTEDMTKVSGWLKESDGFVLVTPEYNHSFSGVLKNALDNFMPEYEKKPFGIVSYSTGPLGGVRANEALRAVVSELKGVPTPIPMIIPMVQEAFDESGNLKDPKAEEKRVRFMDNFEWYVKALKAARER